MNSTPSFTIDSSVSALIRQESVRVVSEEIEALVQARAHLQQNTEPFVRAVELLLNAHLVIVCGIGKSGIIAHKIAATLTSTGTRAVHLHPAEALHGDIGIAQHGDACVMLSKSGSTAELLALMPTLAARSITTIGILGAPTDSPLARLCTVVLNASVAREACPLNVAPMSSTTVALALGDALAAALMKARGFTAEEFAAHHAAGQLGRNLTMRVQDVMHSGSAMPTVPSGASFREILDELTAKSLGCVCVVREYAGTQYLAGMITDGDIRRALRRFEGLETLTTSDIMTFNPVTTHPTAMLGEALEQMEDRPRQISVLPVVSTPETWTDGAPSLPVLHGVIRVHDIVRAGM
jgi:arabinose-5-phosphate isomerase